MHEDGPSNEAKPADLWVRFVAFIIDITLVSALFFIPEGIDKKYGNGELGAFGV